MITHPASGYHYVNIFPRNVVFSEIHASYRASSLENPWMSAQFSDEGRFPTDDPAAFLIFWQGIPEGLANASIQAKKALRYTESMPVDPGRMENQKDHFSEFEKVAAHLDCVIAHTPTARSILAPYAKKVILAPIGYETSVYGTPDWSKPKTVDIGFYGSMVGKRGAVIEAVRERFGHGLREFGSFGLTRKKDLDCCRVALYVGHCEDPSFATTRIWQTIASSAALLIEGGRDAWPAEAGRHYVQLPPADLSDMPRFLDSLQQALGTDLESVARAAHEDLSKCTVKKCMEDYVAPVAGI